MAKKQYYSYVKTIRGKDYWYNQDGKRISKAKAEKSKRKTYFYKKTKGGFELIPTKGKKSSVVSQDVKLNKGEIRLETFSSSLLGNLSAAIQKKQNIYVKNGDTTIMLYSNEAKAEYSNFIFRLRKKWEDIMSKFKNMFGSMVFNFTVTEAETTVNRKDSIIFDFSSIETDIEEEAEEEGITGVDSALRSFNIYKNKEFKKSFKIEKD